MRHLEASAASASEHVRAQKQEAAHRLEAFDAELDTQRGQRSAKQQRQAQRQSDDLLCTRHALCIKAELCCLHNICSAGSEACT